MFSIQVLRVALAGVAFLGLFACENRPEKRGGGGAPFASTPASARPAPSGGPIAGIERLLHLDAGLLEPEVDPPAPAGNLKMEIDRFTTLDACVTDSSQLAPLVADALEAVGYDSFVRDACRILDAAKARDDRRCEAIAASMLRARCKSTVAGLVGDPESCPWQSPTYAQYGRDATCVAIASRSPGLCAAVEDASGRATCEAIVQRDAGPCASIVSRAGQARCARDAQRWRDAIPAVEAPSAPPARPVGTLQVTGGQVAGGDGGRPFDADLSLDLAQGVVVSEHRDGRRLVVGPLSQGGVGFIASSPHVRATFAVELFVPTVAGRGPSGETDVAGEARVDRAELRLPGHVPLSTPEVRSSLRVRIVKLARERGGPVVLSVSGDLDGEGESWHLRADVTTFVRDVVRVGVRRVPGPPRLGEDAGMR